MSLEEAKLDNRPEYYRSLAFPTRTERLENGTTWGSTSPAIKGIHRDEFHLDGFLGENITIKHDVGRIYEPYIRMRIKGAAAWLTMPSTFQLGGTLGSIVYGKILSITTKEITFEFFNASSFPGGAGDFEIEIFFLDFSTEARFT